MASDLKHRDWLLFSTKSLLLQKDQNITVDIIDTPDGGKRLIASGIKPSIIEDLTFLVNSDQNNNYLYLEDFKVFVAGYNSAVNIPGLVDVVQNAFRNSDINGFIDDHKKHKPFAVYNYNTLAMSAYEGATFSGFVSSYTSLIPFTPDVDNNVSYSITLNPDLTAGEIMHLRSVQPNIC